MSLDRAAGNRRGILAMSAGMGSFVINDALVKFVSESLPASQLIFIRGLFASLLLLVVAHALGATMHLSALKDRKVLLRAAFDAAATFAYLTSLFHLPIATATAINMATPLVVTAMAVLILRERVTLSRWLAIVLGFGGVMLIVQPVGQAFNAWALLCLSGTLLHAGRDLTTRAISTGIPTIVVTVSTALAVTLVAAVGTAASPWKPVNISQMGLLAAASVFLSAGYFLLTISLRAGEISVVSPFRYTGLLFALVLGSVVWRETPNALAFAGIVVLAVAGLWVSRPQPQGSPGSPHPQG